MTLISTRRTRAIDRRESVVRSYCRAFPAMLNFAQGSHVRTVDGKEYIDFLAGCGTLNYGHNDPDMKHALLEYVAKDGIAHSLDLYTEAKAGFLESFHKRILSPRNLDYRVQFTGPTGTNAVEAAIKLARKVTGRSNVVAFTNGFHGMTMGALAATGNRFHRMGAATPLSGVVRLPYDGYLGDELDTAELLDKLLQDSSSGIDLPAAILLEAVQGEGGLNAARPSWIRRIAQIAHAHGALLIIDEVQAGCGRTGTFFAFEEAGVQPDLVPLAKSLSGYGLPMAALLIRPKYDIWKPGEHNGTFRGNDHAFVTARVALDKFWSDGLFAATITAKAALVTAGLEDIASDLPAARLKGRGMFQGIDVGSGRRAKAICARAAEDGLIVETSGPNDEVVKILAPLTTPEHVLSRGLSILRKAARATVDVRPSQVLEQVKQVS